MFATASHQTGLDTRPMNDLEADCIGDLVDGRGGHEPRLEPSWSFLLIDALSATWA